jgi:CBS domain-containing protein
MAHRRRRVIDTHMQVSDCMAFEVQTIDAQASVHEAAERMRRAAVGCLPVIEDGRLAGMITDRDIVVRCVAEDLPPTTPVSHAMTRDPVYCFADDAIEQAVDHMVRAGVRRLLVLDRDGALAGLLSVDDLALTEPTAPLAALVLTRTVERRGEELGDLIADR